MKQSVRWRGLLAPVALALAATVPQLAQAEPLPKDDLERECWLKYTRERTNIRLVDPTTVAFSNLRSGDTVSSPFRIDFSIRGMGVIPAGKPHARAGHHHLLVNTRLPLNPRDKIPVSDGHRHFGKAQTGTVIDLPAGEHTLRLLFADHDHKPYFVYSPELRIRVRGPRSAVDPQVTRADFDASCKHWYEEEISRPRPAGKRALIANLRDGEPVASPVNVRFAVDGFGVAPKGHGTSGLGYFVFDVVRRDDGVVQSVDLSNGATQTTLTLAPGGYTLRLRFVDDDSRLDLTPVSETRLTVVGQERF